MKSYVFSLASDAI